jgi:DNA-binding MarR family transcriptional regulator
VKRLVARGLVARTGGRNVSLQLTEFGWDQLRHDPRSCLEKQGLAELTDQEAGELDRLLEQLTEQLDAHD